uniref:Uncharacterized protein n=1 Tax=Octopus bimaculoides TaxID=37653 RepID=A0A0L8HML7_OCTBM
MILQSLSLQLNVGGVGGGRLKLLFSSFFFFFFLFCRLTYRRLATHHPLSIYT